jgi:hypothetical protein
MRFESFPRPNEPWFLLLALASVSAAAQQAAGPADFPHDMSNYNCSHFDGKACDQAPAPPPDYNPLVGTWVRFSLLRNGFTMQPPNAPLYLKFSSDGYWSMMEFPANRPKVEKPLEQQTPKELFSRFDQMAGGGGNFTNAGQWNYRHHLRQLGPGSGGEASQLREWSFEGNVLLLAGTGAIRSPQARFRKLPNQPAGNRALAGTWQRTSHSIAGTPVAEKEPEYLILGEDGWFHQVLFPPGRTAPKGKPMEQWTTQEYVTAYGGMSAARGPYAATATMLVRRHIGDTDPNLEGRNDTGQYTLQADVMTVQGTDAAGRKYESRYQRMKPFDVWAPLPARGAGAP